MNAAIVMSMAIALLVTWAFGLRSLLPSMLLAFVGISMALFLGGCAPAPPLPSPPSTSASKPQASTPDPVADALGRIGNRTAGQATAIGGNAASSSVYTATGGSFLGQVGSAAVRNTTTEIQRWWYGR